MVLRPFHFHSYIETYQSVGEAQTGVPRGKTPYTAASRPWLVPHVICEPSAVRTHSGEIIEKSTALESATSATGAASSVCAYEALY